MTTSQLLAESEAAELLSLKPNTLAVWRSAHRYELPYVKVGRSVRYRRSDLEAWLQARTVSGIDGDADRS